jgi:hypothetical protein
LTAPHPLIWRSELDALEVGGFTVDMNAVIRLYDEAGNVMERHEHAGDFKEWQRDQNVCDYGVRRLSLNEHCYEIIVAWRHEPKISI